MPVNGTTLDWSPAELAAKAKGLHRTTKIRSLTQLIALQSKLVELGMKEDVTPKDCSSCAVAWARLEAQRMDLMGLARPGQFKPDSPRPKYQYPRKVRAIYSEPGTIQLDPVQLIEDLTHDDESSGQS